MKALVTGGAGFIGSHLVDRLVAQGTETVRVYDNFFRGRLENLSAHRTNPQVDLIDADIRDEERLRQAVDGCDVVYHLAAQSNVMGGVTDMDYSFTTNVVGTYLVLKAAHDAGVRRVVFTSSREAYGEPETLPVPETTPLSSKNSYGASKVAGEMYCQVFHNLFKLPVAVLRLSNVYGPRDFGRVIPLWLDQAIAGIDLTVFGGQQVIDFVWVDLVVDALLRASSAPVSGRPINIGSGQGTPILDLARRILEVVPGPSQLDLRPTRDAEVVRYTADITLMKGLLGLDPPADPLFGLERMAKLRMEGE